MTLAVLLATRSWHVGLWDSVVTGVLFGAGTVLGARGSLARAGSASIFLFVASATLSLGLAEIASRTLLPAPRAAVPSDPPRLVLDDPNATGATFHPTGNWGHDACPFLFPDLYPGVFESRAPSDDGSRRVVLHVGDSMVQGYGGPMAESFPGRLDTWDFFEEAVRRLGAPRLFLTPGFDDVHFTAEGNELLARWLARQLDVLFASPN